MEVHAHTHTARKKWTHYFWEFLMLFLAVFCGFIAEYLLEHKIEKEKGRQYIQMLYEDLRTDTANFKSQIKSYKLKLTHLATRYDCFESMEKDKQKSGCLIDLINYSTSFQDLIYTDRTLQQLKNAGGLRLLPSSDADSIIYYDNFLRLYRVAEETSFQETQTHIRDIVFSMINFSARKQLQETGVISKNNSYLYPATDALLNRYFNLLETYVKYCDDNISGLNLLFEKSSNIISYFKEKYHFKQ